ncbi:hypothetical protein [Actinokineospora globicatena]|uniref:hypothetical protein n=1 Tax=Actinokineospora globicatena TaxID=103729 RepID=UPI0020A27480|nr:hypothetical protein [Actinokineospora globicatena]MCP2306077.1 hypothetical protein [Actinokineospora globicatena]GLW80050.1 hypothetical protein Aglo01_45310 [Actinokineospora globicatena]GLW86879.1 hypothetical protein Aglo02_45180 [Actinokineospora globicatena]
MRYVKVEAVDGGRYLDPTEYARLLPTFADALPPGARAFAMDPDRYDFHGGRCVKDLTLRAVERGDSWVRLDFRHNCWKHEDDLTVQYTGVVDITPADPDLAALNSLMLDEILPHPHGCTHEFSFLSGRLIITSQDLTATWTDSDCPERRPT